MVVQRDCCARRALLANVAGGCRQCSPGSAGKIIRLGVTPSLAEIESTPTAGRAEVKSAPNSAHDRAKMTRK
jgi:hypothetical protein